MEAKEVKSLTTYNTEREEFPIQIKEIKTLYQCNTLKNFYKSKDIPQINELRNEYDNEKKIQNTMKNYDYYVKNESQPLSIRYTVNYKGEKHRNEHFSPQKNTYYKNLNRSNNDLNKNKSVKNIQKLDEHKFPLSAIKKENEKTILKNFISQKISKISSSNNNISNSTNNKLEKETFMGSLKKIVIENKKKIKQNQGKLNNIIKLMKTKESENTNTNTKRNNVEKEIHEIGKENLTQQVFRYVKKIPNKNNEIFSQNLNEKNFSIKNLKRTQMKKQNTIDTNNFIVNGLNQIYKKSFNINEEKYNNYLISRDKDDNKSNKQKPNIYPNRLSSNAINLKSSESVNNMRVRISINDIKNKDKKENIYVNKIKTIRNNNNININNKNINKNSFEDNNSFKCDKKNNINNINILSYNCNSINKDKTIDNKLNIVVKEQYKVNSPKSIYIPKKATSFRGISQDNNYNHTMKRKDISPIYYKKIDNENNINHLLNKNYNNNRNSNEPRVFYYFNSDKREINKNKYIDNYINSNGRATYSRKYSVKKQNYCWKNNSSFDDKSKKSKKNNKENNQIIIIDDDNQEGDNFGEKVEIFDNEINDISSIKINSSYDSYTMDYENNFNKMKFPIFENEYNINEKKNNLVYIHNYNYNGRNFNNDNKDNKNMIKNNNKKSNLNNNNDKTNKYVASTIRQNNLNRITVLLNNKEKYDIIDPIEKTTPIKNNLRYTNSDKKFSEQILISNDQNTKRVLKKNNPNCYSSTTFSYAKKPNSNTNENYALNRNNYNKYQKNYFNKTQKYKKDDKNTNRSNKKNSNFSTKFLKTEILSVGLDDLVVLEERFKDIISALNDDKPVYNSCFDFWNYFKDNCEILNNLNLLVKNEEDFLVLKVGIDYILMSIIFTFDYSYKKNILNQIILFLKEIINFNYQNLILIYDYLLNNTILSKIKNIWETKLYQIVKTDKDINTTFENLMSTSDKRKNNNNDNSNNIKIIRNNTNFIFQTIKIIIKNYKNKNSNILLYFFKEIHKKSSLKDFYYFFKTKILHSNGLFGYMSPQLLLKQNHNTFNTINSPYIKNTSKKKYSLIISLEDTLINFKLGHHNNNGISGLIRFRPGINLFLSEMKKYYEIIVFSLYPQKIGDYLIKAIEKKEKYFDHKFFVQHSVIIENEFVKDLRRIGRPIDKMIIVDNIPHSFKLTKKNGIIIRSYWEEDYNDGTLGELANILIKIAKDGGDVRDGIEKYRKDIIGKVTSRIDL